MSALEKRARGLRPQTSDHPIEIIWRRPSPLSVLRETRIQQAWHLSPTVLVNVGRTVGSRPNIAVVQTVAPRSPPLAPALRLVTTVDRRVETTLVERRLPVLDAAVIRRSPERAPEPAAMVRRPHSSAPGPAAPALTPLPVAPRPPLVRTDRPAPRAEMVVRQTPVPVAVPPSTGSTRAPDAVARSAEQAAAALRAPAPEIGIERITAEVVRALDARLIAWRERMGRS